MDKRSKILLWVLVAAVALSVALAFYRTIIKHDYLISQEISCNPETESCFVLVCDPAEDDTCVGTEAERTSYYKIIEKKAYNIPLCDSSAGDCPEPACTEGESDCQIILCEPGNSDGLPCSGE